MNKRLEALIDCVVKGSIVADIGTDHAFVPIKLIQDGIAAKCYACDVIDGPCMIARNHVEKEGLQEVIQVIKSNGFEHVPSDIDTAIIAGMGFSTAKKILEEGLKHVEQCKRVIVQVNKNVDDLRQWISNRNYTIVDEKMIEDDHIYQIVVFNTNHHENYSEEEILLGPILLQKRSELFVTSCKSRLNKCKQIEKVLPQNDERFNQLTREIAILTKVLNKG